MPNEIQHAAPVTVITGAGSGIGRETAIALARAGHRLLLVGRREKPLLETATLAGGECEALVQDVAAHGAAAAVVGRAVDRFGRLDSLVNNAGWAPRLAIKATDEATIRKAFDINAVGPACLAAEAFRVMASFQDGRTRRIVNISSLATRDPYEGFYAYAASKASMNLASVVLDREGRSLAGCTVRSFALAFGAVETGMLRSVATTAEVPSAMSAAEAGAIVAAAVRGSLDHLHATPEGVDPASTPRH